MHWDLSNILSGMRITDFKIFKRLSGKDKLLDRYYAKYY